MLRAQLFNLPRASLMLNFVTVGGTIHQTCRLTGGGKAPVYGQRDPRLHIRGIVSLLIFKGLVLRRECLSLSLILILSLSHPHRFREPPIRGA